MSLYDVKKAETDPPRFLSARWRHIRAAIFRWFDRERELIRLRVTFGLISEARRRDAAEYREMHEQCRALNERVKQLEHERDVWRAARG
ncbi:MAG: hypothetical protein EPO20_22655 [Betaproteobacteria bacterium]|nr:MAG: hypothetical protein EPO20_22655 [Betaproteobacteria bacterium]